MQPKGLWKYVLFGLLAWFFVNQQHEGLKYLDNARPAVKHAVNFSFLILFGVIGYLAWGLYTETWLRRLWVIIYSIVIGIIAIIGLIDLIYRIPSINVRTFLIYFRLFFTSPLPFGILIFLLKLKRSSETA